MDKCLNVSTHGSVVPVHPEVVVGEDCGRPVDVVQGELHRGHHPLACTSTERHNPHFYLRSDRLTYAGLGVARRGGEEAGDVDVVLVVAVVVGVDLLAELAELPRPGLVSPRPATHQQQGHQPQPHGHQVALGSPMVTTRQH